LVSERLKGAIDKRRLAMSGMQDDKKFPDDIGIAHEVTHVSLRIQPTSFTWFFRLLT
jgi:hypothetical protein